MPNKTFYASDDDLPLLDRAQSLAGGNLSAAITAGLRQFVDTETAAQAGYEQITVRVGPVGSRHRKRFFGFRVAQWRRRTSGQTIEVLTVYRTRRGRFAVHRQDLPFWLVWMDLADPEAGAASEGGDRSEKDQGAGHGDRAMDALEARMRRKLHRMRMHHLHRLRMAGLRSGPDGGPAPGAGRGPGPGAAFDWWLAQGKATLEVYETLEDMRGHVPDGLLELVQSGAEVPIEDLDI